MTAGTILKQHQKNGVKYKMVPVEAKNTNIENMVSKDQQNMLGYYIDMSMV